jgi:hypothetical protein
MVGEYFPWAFHHTPHTSAHLVRTDSTSSSMSIGSDGPLHGDPSTPPSHFIYTQANHKSVLGIGAYAKQHGAQLHCLTMEQMQQWLQDTSSTVPESHHRTGSGKGPCNNGLCWGGNR